MITEFGGKIQHNFTRNIYYPVNQLLPKRKAEFMKQCNYIDVYQSIYSFNTYLKSDVNTCKIIAPFYLDLDMDIQNEKDYSIIRTHVNRTILALKSIFKLTEASIQVYFSGAKGFHILVDSAVFNIPQLCQLHTIYKTWALHLRHAYQIDSIDTQIYDRRRLFRIPNTINGKTGLYKVAIPTSKISDSTFDSIQQWGSAPKIIPQYDTSLNAYAASIFLSKAQHILSLRENKKQDMIYASGQKRKLLPCIKQLLSDPVKKGNRNNIAVILANSLYQSHYTTEEIVALLREWNQRNTPPLPIRELLATIHSAEQMHQAGRKYGCQTVKENGLCVGCDIGAK
jgi:hypothetical protein